MQVHAGAYMHEEIAVNSPQCLDLFLDCKARHTALVILHTKKALHTVARNIMQSMQSMQGMQGISRACSMCVCRCAWLRSRRACSCA